MSRSVFLSAGLFAAGLLALEGAGSILHAKVLRDIPPELTTKGVTLGWMLKRKKSMKAPDLLSIQRRERAAIERSMFSRSPSR